MSNTSTYIDLLPDPSVTDKAETDLRGFLQKISATKVLRGGLSDGSEIRLSGEVIHELASKCLASAFVSWSHRMTSEYVDRFGSQFLREERLPQLLSGERIGSTALATALADRSGKELLPITYRKASAGYQINGVIPWASNLYSDTLVVFAARDEDSDQRVLFAAELGFEGVSVKPAEGLLALNATSSGTIRFENLILDDRYVLTHEVDTFFSRMRPRFLLLQTAFCLGLSAASLEQAEDAGGALPFRQELLALRTQYQEIYDRWLQLLGVQGNYQALPDQHDPLEYLQLRLQAAVLAQAITRIELAAVGGRGYFVSHPTSRRIRESLFLSIQAPTEGSLKWEISQLAS